MKTNGPESLALQRVFLQNQLQIQRIKYVAQLNDTGEPSFPRSATMRFLTGKNCPKLVADVAAKFATNLVLRQLCLRHPGLLALSQVIQRLLAK